jgi:hypothetical protein
MPISRLAQAFAIAVLPMICVPAAWANNIDCDAPLLHTIGDARTVVESRAPSHVLWMHQQLQLIDQAWRRGAEGRLPGVPKRCSML